MPTRRLTGTFATRRDAEMAVETLVQEYEVDRAVVEVAAAGEANTAGTVPSGADATERHRGTGAPGDPEGDRPIVPFHAEGAHAGGITVSAELDEHLYDRAMAAFRNYGTT